MSCDNHSLEIQPADPSLDFGLGGNASSCPPPGIPEGVGLYEKLWNYAYSYAPACDEQRVAVIGLQVAMSENDLWHVILFLNIATTWAAYRFGKLPDYSDTHHILGKWLLKCLTRIAGSLPAHIEEQITDARIEARNQIRRLRTN